MLHEPRSLSTQLNHPSLNYSVFCYQAEMSLTSIKVLQRGDCLQLLLSSDTADTSLDSFDQFKQQVHLIKATTLLRSATKQNLLKIIRLLCE